MKNIDVIVFGSQGMLGNILVKCLDEKFNVLKITKSDVNVVKDINKVEFLVKPFSDIVIINCIGITKDKINPKNSQNIVNAIEVNSKFPHILSNIASKYSSRIIHISTDAVFAKNSGRVSEKDTTNPDCLYGMTKLLGEPIDSNCLTIRTSIIGPSLNKKNKSLWNWLINEKSPIIKGFVNSIWSGCTTLQLSEFISDLINKDTFVRYRDQTPIIHFCPNTPISKYSLLEKIINELDLNKKIIKTKKHENESKILQSNFYQSTEKNLNWSLEINRLNQFYKF